MRPIRLTAYRMLSLQYILVLRHELPDVMYASLAKRIALGSPYSLGRYVELLGDLFGLQALAIKLHDLLLTCRQSGVELRVADDARILAFPLYRAADLLESESTCPVYVLLLVKAPEVAADEPMTYEVAIVVNVSSALVVNLGQRLECFGIFTLNAGEQDTRHLFVLGLVSVHTLVVSDHHTTVGIVEKLYVAKALHSYSFLL